MKKILASKVAGLMALIMSVSLLVPAFAFAAAHFTQPVNGNFAVYGEVYVDQSTYEDDNLSDTPVTVYLYSDNGYVLNSDGTRATVQATYNRSKTESSSAAGQVYYQYNIDSDVYQEYSHLKFRYFYTPVTDDTYEESAWVTRSRVPVVVGPIGGGVVGGDEITAYPNGSVNEAELIAALANGGTATVVISGTQALLPASALTGTGSVVVKNAAGISYTLPVSAIDVAALASALGVDASVLTIRVELVTLAGADAQGVAQAADAVNGDVIAPAVDFKVVAVGGSKEQEVTDFPVYVSRDIPLTTAVTDTSSVTGIVYTPGEGVSFVPTTIATADGKSVATLKRKGNSIYTVVQVTPKSFTDLAGHWAKADVEKLAGKLVVEGTSATRFEPKRSITRAEVAALITRSLGLETVTNSTYTFSDVGASKWYAGTVSTAAAAGIINGYTDGTFKPDAAITRRDLAAMIVRAQAYAGKTVTLTDAQVSAALAGFTDTATLGGQKLNVAIAVSSGLMKGQSSKSLAGLANTNRAEAATLIARFLTNVGFIN